MMKPDLGNWQKLEVHLMSLNRWPFFHEREIWACHIGINIGSEQAGKGELSLRPIIVLKKFNSHTLWAIPLSNTIKNTPHHFTFSFKEHEATTALLSQLRHVDARRLSYIIGKVNNSDFCAIKEKLRALLL